MPKITFLPADVTLECDDGATIFDVGWNAGVGIESACVGKATCGLCRVKIVDGEQNLNEQNDAERKHLGNVYFLTKVRLSCQSIVTGGDVVVEIAPKRRKKTKEG